MTETDRTPFSDAIVIAGASALSYAVAAVYETSYARVFGIPSELIHVELAIVLKSFGAIAGGWLGVWYVMDVVVGILGRGVKTFRGRLLAIALIPAFVLAAGLLGILGLQHWKGVLFFVIVMGICTAGVSYAFPLIFYRQHSTYRAKYEAYAAEQRQAPGLVDLTERHFGTRGLVIILAAWLSIFFAFLAGTYDALDREVFLRPVQNRPEVVLRIYGNNIVVAAFDDKSRTILPRYRVMQLGDTSLTLRSYKLGKVRMAQPAPVP